MTVARLHRVHPSAILDKIHHVQLNFKIVLQKANVNYLY